MFVYLVRHGEARSAEDDPERGLTEQGFLDVGAVAGYMAKICTEPVRIYHSGKTRARQTASILSDALKASGGIAETDALLPHDDPAIWRERLLTAVEDVMLVGHLPHLTRLASLLLAGEREKSVIDFRPGGVACLRKDESGQWLVEWMVTPDMAR